jgi:hypothetical protein
MMRIAIHLSLVAALLGAHVTKQNTQKRDFPSEEHMSVTNQCFTKGGIGIVITGLYIVVKSSRNELRFGENERWLGLDAPDPEVVFFFERRIWESNRLPRNFDVSKAIVIVFEADKVRFFDFQEMSGGYYKRIIVEH